MMVSLGYVIATYFIPLFGLIILFFFIKTNPLMDKKQTKLFSIAICINLLMIFLTSLDYICASFPFNYNWLIRRITSFMNFSFSPVIPYIILKIYNQKNTNKLLFIPIGINFTLCFISIFTPLIFFINTLNQYSRGFLFFLPFVTSILYMLRLVITPGHQHIRSKKNERYFLLALCGILLLSMYFEVIHGFRFLDWATSALGLILYYLLVSINCTIIDSLTGAYNRFIYSRTLTTINHHQHGVLVTIDINDFKGINDTYGHAAGDTYLIDFVAFINNSLDGKGIVYRIGGDEFFVLAKKQSLKTIQTLMEHIYQEGLKLQFSFAYGVVEYQPDIEIEHSLEEADQLMYQMKKEIKSINHEMD